MRSRTERARLCLCLVILLGMAGCSQNRSAHSAHRDGAAASPDLYLSSDKNIRRLYPFSLIPGGVESGAEIQAYRAVDRTLDEHYRGLGTLVLTSLDKDRRLYASYRMSDAIYWTKNRILVHAGEHVLSDGKDLVRGRCGNRLSETRMIPVREFEPPSVSMDRFIPQIVAFEPPGLTEPYAPPALPDFPEVRPAIPIVSRAPSIAPDAIPIVGTTGIPGGIDTGGSRGPQRVFTPEPGTWLLAVVGLLSGIAARGILKRKRRS